MKPDSESWTSQPTMTTTRRLIRPYSEKYSRSVAVLSAYRPSTGETAVREEKGSGVVDMARELVAKMDAVVARRGCRQRQHTRRTDRINTRRRIGRVMQTSAGDASVSARTPPRLLCARHRDDAALLPRARGLSCCCGERGGADRRGAHGGRDRRSGRAERHAQRPERRGGGREGRPGAAVLRRAGGHHGGAHPRLRELQRRCDRAARRARHGLERHRSRPGPDVPLGGGGGRRAARADRGGAERSGRAAQVPRRHGAARTRAGRPHHGPRQLSQRRDLPARRGPRAGGAAPLLT
eukprot:scaffold11565_cov60-Phaeocystis_antarctica.AAC.1